MFNSFLPKKVHLAPFCVKPSIFCGKIKMCSSYSNSSYQLMIIIDNLVYAGQIPFLFISGFHYRWNRAVGRRHPSLWHFIRKMKDEQRLLSLSAAAAQRGNAPPPRQRKWRNLEGRIQRLKREYNAGDRTLEEYWDAVVYVVKAFI